VFKHCRQKPPHAAMLVLSGTGPRTLRLRQKLLLEILDFAHSGGNFSFAYVNGFPLLACSRDRRGSGSGFVEECEVACLGRDRRAQRVAIARFEGA
jgi:hypothetical protein